MDVHIDFQGFQGPKNSFIFKEFALFDFKNDVVRNMVLKPPKNITLSNKHTKKAKRLVEGYLGLNLADGDTEYDTFSMGLKKLMSEVSTVFVKGVYKKIELEKLLEKEIINLEEFGCPSFKELQQIYGSELCENHRSETAACTLQNAKNLAFWQNEYLSDTAVHSDSESEETSSCSCLCIQQITEIYK